MKKEITEKLAMLVTSAFWLVAALAWNTAIQDLFKRYFGAGSNLSAELLYAAVVTVIAVIATLWIGRISEKFK